VGFELPFVATERIPDGTIFEISGVRACLRFSYHRSEDIFRSGLLFDGVRALRCRASGECTSWHKDPYGQLVEVADSDWVAELEAVPPLSIWEMHHYMIYLDQDGCYEIIAKSWEVLPELSGDWTAGELSPFLEEPGRHLPLDQEVLEKIRRHKERVKSLMEEEDSE
jgi:hypothetical protein